MNTHRAPTLFGVAALLACCATAAAAPPANDDRQQPATLTVPSGITGTTLEATRDAADPQPGCGPTAGPSVWYALQGVTPGRVALEMDAAEGAGYAVTVYRRDAGDLVEEVCDATDRHGSAALFFTAEAGERYVVQVSSGVRTDAGPFTLQALRPEPIPTLPAPTLPARGARGTVDVVRDTEDAYSVRMDSGTTYRINLSGGTNDRCRVALTLLGPDATDLEATPVLGRGCGGYVTYTPGPDAGGRHTLVVQARPGFRNTRYRLTVAAIGPDDQAPGLTLPLGGRVRGAVSGRGIDRLDVYRFTVAGRSQERLNLRTTGTMDLRIIRPTGGVVACSCDGEAGDRELLRALAAGDYLAVVRSHDGSAGRYTLRRRERVITSARLTMSPAVTTTGGTVAVQVRVQPAPTGGRVRVDVEQFDPLGGWRFRHRLTAVVTGGVARMSFRASQPGPWRARGEYLGTEQASPSSTGSARILVRG